ncbi:TnsA-like heteromeric transposase endonuclease subunit [Kitasatospora sp. NPDC048343]|uniref:TnsA-like heteromeric transposase endonuclease subunit n=1 Tax=Kitasatospora sp. NPDC048343 TaxID=3154717 RepID=UPI003406E87E
MRRFTWRTGQWHRPGLEYLVSTGRHHGFESFEEESLLLVADFAAGLTEALSQPFRLRFDTAAGSMEHIPDFLLLTGAGPWLVDVRPAGRIRPEDALKFAASAEAALAAGWRYGVVTGWRDNVLALVDVLSAGRRQLTDPLGLQGELLGAASAGPLPFGELVERCSVPAVARAHAVHLLWHRRLGVDVSAPLTDASLVRRACAEVAGSGAGG